MEYVAAGARISHHGSASALDFIRLRPNRRRARFGKQGEDEAMVFELLGAPGILAVIFQL